ncbi:MAG: methyltransferase domain-containing protein [Eubacteriales bacterium]|nr:methyltransferase domain-containing protein [Eubacteriales bacterium]
MEPVLSKKAYATRLLQNRQAAFRCPICAAAMTADEQGLLCSRGHRFDLNKKGGLCLLRDYGAGRVSEYDATLFESRRWIFEHGFFDPLLEKLRGLARETSPALTVDLGCGEGSVVSAMAAAFPGNDFLGVDISAAGIRAAAGASRPNTLFFQGDLAALPLADGCADLLLNILSPARYEEFARVMKPGALLVKAAPTPRHLWQLRRALGQDYQKEEDVRRRFAQRFQLIREELLEYDAALDTAQAASHLLNMTPLGLNQRENMTFSDKDITFSLNIYIGICRAK